MIIDLLAEAGIDEAIADKIVEAFESKLDEGIKSGVEVQLESAKQDWALRQADLIEGLLESTINTWGETNKQLLESAANAEMVNEATSALRTLLGVDTVAFNESVTQYSEGKIQMLNGTVETLQGQLDEAKTAQETLEDELTGYRRAEIFAEHTEGLSDLACDKITEALSKQSFADDGDFESLVVTLAEAHRPAKGAKAVEENAIDNIGTQGQFNENKDQQSNTKVEKPLSLVEATRLQMQGKLK